MEKIKKINFSTLWITLLIFVFITIASIVYATFNTTLTFMEGQVMYRPVADIRIVDFKLHSVTNGGIEEYNSSFSKHNIYVGLELPNINSTVTYEVTVTNFVDITMILNMISDINFSNSDIEYRLIDMQIDDIILGIETKVFYIEFKYKDIITSLNDTTLGANLEFEFITNDHIPPKLEDSGKQKSYFITEVDNINFATLVSAMDNVDGDVTEFIELSVTPDFDKNKTGTYEITYNVKDKAGNSASPLTIQIEVWNFIKIINGQYHGLALGSNGTVWSWGWNSNGQRGIGSSTSSAAGFRAPTQIDQSYFDNLPVIDIAAGYLSSFALNSEGQAYGWGQGTSYQLGNNSTSNQTSPVAITQPSGIKFKQISSFYQTGAAVGSDGNIYTWGYSLYGANGGASDRNVPSAITTSGDFISVSQGYYGGAAINDSGQVYVWGTNLDGELGAGNTSGYNHPPTLVSRTIGSIKIKQISYGVAHLLALSENGQVYAWGSGGSGRLCLNSTSTKSEPTLIPNISGASLVNTGYDFSQIMVGNNIYSCGYANYGELFGGNTTAQRVPYLSTMTNVANNVSYVAGKFDNAYVLSKNGAILYGIGYSDTAGQEFGSVIVQSTSTSTAIAWSFTPPTY